MLLRFIGGSVAGLAGLTLLVSLMLTPLELLTSPWPGLPEAARQLFWGIILPLLILILGVKLYMAGSRSLSEPAVQILSLHQPLTAAALESGGGRESEPVEVRGESGPFDVEEKLGRLVPRERSQIESVLALIEDAPCRKTARDILSKKSTDRPRLANPDLQLIAYAVPITPARTMVKGVASAVATWTAFPFLAVPAFMLSRYDLSGGSDEVIREMTRRAIARTRTARRHLIRPHAKLQRDPRPPVLYLRPFWTDSEGETENYFQATAEERMAAGYRGYGPVIAIGEPGRVLPLLGATRIYFDDEWKAGVVYLMSVSQAVVINAGLSQNALWELGVARKMVAPERLFISFTSTAGDDQELRERSYALFRRQAEVILGCELPERIGSGMFIRFTGDWKATVIGA